MKTNVAEAKTKLRVSTVNSKTVKVSPQRGQGLVRVAAGFYHAFREELLEILLKNVP